MALTAILGGTFDPVHLGHIETARELMDRLPVTEVRLVPNASPVHRPAPAPAHHRLAMLQIAVDSHPGLRVGDVEVRRGGPSYTLDTLVAYRAELGERPLALVMGSDAFAGFDSWRDWHRIGELAHLIVVMRPDCAVDSRVDTELTGWARQRRTRDVRALTRAPAGALLEVALRPWPISSTDIRARLSRGCPVGKWLPAGVEKYALGAGLYGAGQEMVEQ